MVEVGWTVVVGVLTLTVGAVIVGGLMVGVLIVGVSMVGRLTSGVLIVGVLILMLGVLIFTSGVLILGVAIVPFVFVFILVSTPLLPITPVANRIPKIKLKRASKPNKPQQTGPHQFPLAFYYVWTGAGAVRGFWCI